MWFKRLVRKLTPVQETRKQGLHKSEQSLRFTSVLFFTCTECGKPRDKEVTIHRTLFTFKDNLEMKDVQEAGIEGAEWVDDGVEPLRVMQSVIEDIEKLTEADILICRTCRPVTVEKLLDK